MKRLLLLCGVLLVLASAAAAQPGKNLYPTATKSLVVFHLKDFDKRPIPKARIAVEAAEGTLRYEGKTDKDGIWECLLPINAAYWVNVGDSQHVGQVTIPNKPSTITRHTTYFNGWIDGKLHGSERPLFNMMPPADGQAVIDYEFDGLQGEPLAGEEVTMVADGSKKEYKGTTDAEGRLQMRVPIGENYTLVMPYNANFDHLEFPAHGGSYSAKVRYVYAGKAAIERMRAERLARQAEYDAYMRLSLEEQREVRDGQGHKKVFESIPVAPSEAPFTVEKTSYGMVLSTEGSAPVTTPCYIDGKIVAGAGWDSDVLSAVDVQTGEPIWSVSLEEHGISNIEGGDSVVVCATESCTIYALAAGTGRLLWSKWLATYVLSAPCIADGRVYIGYEDEDGSRLGGEAGKDRPYAMACFDLKTGEVVWQQWIKGEVMSSAVAVGNRIFFNTFSGHSYVLDAADGRVVAEQQLFATSAPTLSGEVLCMAQRDGNNLVARERIAAFDPTSLTLVKAGPWMDAPYLDPAAMRKTKFASAAGTVSLNTGASGEPIATSGKVGPLELVGAASVFAIQTHEGARPLAFGGKLYVAQGHVLRCIDPKSMTQAWEWQYPTTLDDDGGAQISPPIVVGDKIAISCMDGQVREFDPARGYVLQTYATGLQHRQQPIAAIGNYFIPSLSGKLAVVRTGDRSVNGWPCWGGNAARSNAR